MTTNTEHKSTPSNVVTGLQFLEIYGDQPFITFINADDITFDSISCTDGLNISNETKHYYFFNIENTLTDMSRLNINKCTNIRRVTVPEDAIVTIYDSYFKSSYVILSPSEVIGEDLELFKHLLQDCKTPFRGLCGEQQENIFNKLDNKLDFLCVLSEHDTIKINVQKYINNGTIVVSNEMVYNIFKKYPKLSSLLIHSYENYEHILSHDGLLLTYISGKILEAHSSLCNNKLFLDYDTSMKKINKLLKIAVVQNYNAIQFVPSSLLSEELYMCAFEQSEDANKYVKEITSKELSEFVLLRYPQLITNPLYANGITEQVAQVVVKYNPLYLQYIPCNIQTSEICTDALIGNIKACKYVDDQFLNLLSVTFSNLIFQTNV